MTRSVSRTIGASTRFAAVVLVALGVAAAAGASACGSDGGRGATPTPDGGGGGGGTGPGSDGGPGTDSGPGSDSGPVPGTPICGNGARDPGEACEGNTGCTAGMRCTADCTCAPVPAEPVTSLGLIGRALAAGTIDYPTSLLYRTYALFGDSRLPPEYVGTLRRREDNALFLEASRAWGSFTPEVRAKLEPFMVRPDDPRSIYAPAPGTQPLLRQGGGGATLEELKCPYAPGAGTPDWRATPTDHFVVWSCGGGDLSQDADAPLRAAVGTVAEAAFAAITPATAPPRKDSYSGGPAPQERTDVYIVQGADCYDRQGICVELEPDEEGKRPLAAVVPAAPCDRANPGRGGALTSSAFMLIDRDSVTTAPPAGPWKFRYVFAHEFFHAVAMGLNLEAQGGGCFNPAAADAQGAYTSWLSEASAEWAAWAFFADDGRDERRNLFLAFQEYRHPDEVSLLSVEGQRPYEAFLYPFFVQQEMGGATAPFLGVWKGSGAARSPKDLDDRLDAVLGFADHFRDFTVRNFNRSPELPMSERHYQGQDTAIPANEAPIVQQPGLMLAQPGVRFSPGASLQPLTAQYEHYLVNENVRHVLIDAGALANSGFVDLDALVNVRGTWERRKGARGVLEFCRDNDKDDIQELYLIITNHDRQPNGKVSGTYDVTMRASCPAGWSGWIKYVETIDEDTYELVAGEDVYTTSKHKRIEQTWTVIGNTPAAQSPLRVDQIETSWQGTLSNILTATAETGGCYLSPPTQGDPKIQRSEQTGSGSGKRSLSVGSVAGGGFILQPLPSGEQNNTIEGTIVSTATLCSGETVTNTSTASPEYENLALVVTSQAFAPLMPAPDNPNRFVGSSTFAHMENPTTGGTSVLDMSFSWDLTRTPER